MSRTLAVISTARDRLYLWATTRQSVQGGGGASQMALDAV